MRSPSIHSSISGTSGTSSTRAATRTTDAPKPFDALSLSDAIIRSDDSIDFFVLRSFLSFVSPTFNKLYAAALETKNGLPIITVSEDSETLQCLLSLIYPHAREPQVAPAPLFSQVCRAAHKYSMDVIISKLRTMLNDVEPSHSPDTAVAHHFLIYVIATQYGWDKEATKAARYTLSTPWRNMPYNTELRNINGADFCQYLALREGHNTKPLPAIAPPAVKADKETPLADARIPFDSSAKADIILRSTDNIDFHVLRNLLGFVTPAFDDVDGTEEKNGLPVLPFEEDGATLRHLLCLIYPCVESPIDDMDTFVKVCQTAQKYRMSVVEDKLKQQLEASRHIVDDPVRTLWVAIAFGWGQVAKKAAMNALALPAGGAVISFEQELRLVTGADVYWFIQYRLACCDAACEAVLKDRLFAPDKTNEKETFVQRIVDRLKASPRGISIVHACAFEIQETSKAPSEHRASLLFRLLKKRDKLEAVVEDAISKVRSYSLPE